MLFELQLDLWNKPYLDIITSFAYQGKQLNEIYSVPWEDDGILPTFLLLLQPANSREFQMSEMSGDWSLYLRVYRKEKVHLQTFSDKRNG